MESLLQAVEREIEELELAIEEAFSVGWEKYASYQIFCENFSADVSLEKGFVGTPSMEKDSFSDEKKDKEDPLEEDEFKKKTRQYRKPMVFYPGIEIQRVPSGTLGYGVLGRCFPYAGLIQIRQDLYGDDFFEVLTHELTHMQHPHLGETEVRGATRMKLPFTPKWH